MSSQAQFWQTLRPIRKVGKLRGIIEVPIFTAACGPSNYSRQWFGSYFIGTGAVGVYPTAAATFECWIKPLSGIIGTDIAFIFKLSINENIMIKADRTIRFRLNGGVSTTVTSARQLNVNQWNHVACVWDGTTMMIYINGILDVNTAAMGGTLPNIAALFRLMDYFNGSGAGSAAMRCNELRIWNVARTQQQILAAMHGPRDISGNIDVGLTGYWPLNEGVGTTITNRIAANAFVLTYTTYGSPDASEWNLTDSYPYKLGASFFPVVFPIDTSGKSFSLKFPVKKPYADVNFVPCIRWIDPSDGVTVKRYRLWDGPSSFDVSPMPALYRGQKIPSVAYLEIWNFDGNSTVDLTQAVDLETSILHVVTAANEVAQTADATTAQDTTLAEPFPLTPFPLTFPDTQSFT